MKPKNYTETRAWRNKVRKLSNGELLDLYKQTNPDAMNTTEYLALIFLRGEVLYRMMELRPSR